jgi:SP family myo-inositol transporter-like MFS transporter 13
MSTHTLDNKTHSASNVDDNVNKTEASYKEELDSSSTSSRFDDSIEQTSASKAVWLITFTVSMGGFLFGQCLRPDRAVTEPNEPTGYDTGVISAVLVNLKTDLGHVLSSSEEELITSLTSGGALIGALIAGLPADKYGRKLGVYIGCLLFLVGSIIQAAAFSLPQMAAGRFVVGLGVGSAAMIVPLYIGEIAPARYRGRMIAFDNMSVTLGQLVSYGLGAGLTKVPHGWRYMVAIGGVPPIILATLLPKCPESPRQLISHGKVEQASRVIARTYPEATEAQVSAKVNHILWTLENENTAVADKSLWWQFKQLHCVGSNLRALTATCTVMAISQLGMMGTPFDITRAVLTGN